MRYSRIICCAVLTVCFALVFASVTDGATPRAKNIIVFIADGCGFNHVAATSLYNHGETGTLVYESFPLSIAMCTYQAGQGYDPVLVWDNFNYVRLSATDSSAAATAMACGYKTYGGAIGVSIDGKPLPNVVERAEELGKSTGVITSVQFSHATPAGFVAHNASRNNYSAIALEMIHNSAVDVIMGCGHPLYDNNGNPLTEDKEPNYNYVGNKDTWTALEEGKAGGDATGDGKPNPWKLIQTKEEFQSLAEGETPDRVIGVAKVAGTLQQGRGGDDKAEPYAVPFIENMPALEEMTRAALNVLDNNPQGFFLMVEGGAVDWAGHANQSGRMIEEMDNFTKSVEAVIEWVEKNSSWNETLVIVTSDHETGYLNGKGSGIKEEGPVWNPVTTTGKGVLPEMSWHSGDHTNSLVPFYAKGPEGALNLFHRKTLGFDPGHGRYIDNTSIANVIFTLLW